VTAPPLHNDRVSHDPKEGDRWRGPIAARFELIGIYLALAALTWVVFGQTLSHPFVAYDDQTYVYQNRVVSAGLTGPGFVSAFTECQARNWHPLTTLSHMLDCELFGLDAGGHHFTNVLLHTAAVLLLFATLRGATGRMWLSAFVAVVFAIHPLRAESVAWVAERKDVLSAVFFMLTLGAYVRYAKKPSLRAYLMLTVFFALGLMSKSMLVTLPLLLLLLDYWPLERFRNAPSSLSLRKLIVEKIPLLFLSLAAALITFVAQRHTVGYTDQEPLDLRLGNAVISYVTYIGQMFWPAKLAVFYPQPSTLGFWPIVLSLLLLGGITAVAFKVRRHQPYLLVGWLWYLIALLPVIGLVQVGLQARADRYTYLPQVGLCVAFSWGLAALPIWKNRARRALASVAAAIIVGLLAWQAGRQTSYWRSTERLWTHAAAVTTNNDLAHYNLAAIFLERGQLDDAIWHYEQALALSGDRESHHHMSAALVHNNLAIALARKGRIGEAMAQLQRAVELRDDFADAHANLAVMLAQQGDTAGAILHFEKALLIPPEDAPSHLGLAALLWRSGRKEEALAHYRRALQIAPGSVPRQNAFSKAINNSALTAISGER
jgi:tetratricopeptide (TPR) repeat protein